MPSDSGAGVAFVATMLLGFLLDDGVEVDCFLAGAPEELPSALQGRPGLRVITVPHKFEYGRWYSCNDISKMLSGAVFNLVAQRRLARAVADANRSRQYDLLYQFSHLETAALRPSLRALPPVVLHPEVHAASELRWVWRERRAALAAGGSRTRFLIGGAVLGLRTVSQRRGVGMAARIIAPSERFADLVASDYHVPADRFRTVPNPVSLERFTPGDPSGDGVVRLLFVSRIAVRKGVQDVVALSHHLADLAGRVRIDVVGDRSFFSDYTHLLADANLDVIRVVGPVPGDEMRERMASTDILLQPSRYEPFGLSVAEALACGVPVVVTPEVGASEGVDPLVCRRCAPGNPAAFATEVRRLIEDLEDPERRRVLRATAREEAERLFGRDRIAAALRAALFDD